MESLYPNGLLIQITDINIEDAFYHKKKENLIGALLMATSIEDSMMEGYSYVKGEIAKESDRHFYKKGESIHFYAAKYKEVGVENMIKELRYTNFGIDEYIL